MRKTLICLLATALLGLGMPSLWALYIQTETKTAIAAADPSKNQGPFRRGAAEREKAVKDEGGNAASEAAVAKGLLWLALHQAPDGSWSLENFNQHSRPDLKSVQYADDKTTGKGPKNDTAGAAFGVLPFLAAGVTHKPSGKVEQDKYVKTVQRGLNYLMNKQGKDGSFPGGMYAHALATITVCEAYAMTADPLLKRSAQAAVNYIILAQDPKFGGWRYQPRQGGDTSVMGWQIQALKTAQMGGLMVPAATYKAAEKWLDSCESMDGGGYGYTGPMETPTLTAVGLLCRQYLGTPPRNANLLKGLDKLKKNAAPQGQKNCYYEYYAAQVFHHMGGDHWKFWNEGADQKKGMRDILIERQDKDGSWDPKGDGYGTHGGRIMQTSLLLLSLEVYYRHAPLYKREAPE